MRATTLITLAAALGSAVPAFAQDAPAAGGERVNTIIVYGNDPCPASQGDEITVCARKAEGERYRIPSLLRETPSTRSESWNQRVLAYETVGRAGTNSCSPVGPGGVNGCTQKLIAAERAKRAATVDAESAATQSRVEQAEKDYAARETAREEAAEAAKAKAKQ